MTDNGMRHIRSAWLSGGRWFAVFTILCVYIFVDVFPYVDDSSSNWPKHILLFVGVWALAGLGIGTWKALWLFTLFPALTLLSGTERDPAGDQPLWSYYLVVSLTLALPALAVGVLARKLVDRRFRESRRQRTGR